MTKDEIVDEGLGVLQHGTGAKMQNESFGERKTQTAMLHTGRSVPQPRNAGRGSPPAVRPFLTAGHFWQARAAFPGTGGGCMADRHSERSSQVLM
ncbi:hypothetical protein ABH15_11510 [Methanoculleus taiwanensis]|uniref:Uncharacterized protein n=1 Tax=Methanoculleus taiwanensis TaxID=1550565 RepID=A0A498GZV7_9EURY|nr:hypothetical protein ABH15_11510 [Methanoculleus taiwanensis]